MSGVTTGVRRLGDICLVRKGTSITERGATPGQIPVVAGGTRPSYFHDTANREAGAVTVSASGANAGFVSCWSTPIWASDCTTVESSTPEVVDGGYIFYFLKSLEGTVIKALRRGAAQPHVYAKDIQEIEIPLPPVAEQRRIVSILDAADALRTKRRQALAKLDALTESIYFDVVSAADAAEWPKVELRDLVEVRGGKRLPKGAEYADGVTGHPYIRVTDLMGGTVAMTNLQYLTDEVQRSIRKYTVATGDLIISIAGSIGLIATVPEALTGANLTENAAKLVISDPERVNSEYLAAALRSKPMQAQIAAKTGQVTIGKLALFRIESLVLPLPPLEVQRDFALRIAAVRSARPVLESSASAFGRLFSSLQHLAFRGEL